MARKKVFKQPYLGVENKDSEVHSLIGLHGEFSVVISLTNNVQQYSADDESYKRFHSAFLNIIKILGEGFTIQKLDILSKSTYTKQVSEAYLQRKYDAHFHGREYNSIHTYLVLTKALKSKGRFDEDYKAFKLSITKVVQALDTYGFEPKLLREEELNMLYLRYITMNFSEKSIVLENFQAKRTHVEIGDRQVKSISLIDIDRIDLPDTVAPFTVSGSGGLEDFPLDTMHFLHNVPGFRTLVYNQVIEVPKQTLTMQKLQAKQNKHKGIPDPENDHAVEDIQNMFEGIARNSQLLVKAHFNILVSADESELSKTTNSIENALFTQGIIPSKNAYNQLELFRSAIPGNSSELKEYDMFLTTAEAAVCFFFKEKLPIDEPAPKGFSIRFTDRQGVPISIDPADYSREVGLINNRNKFTIGPSGSGKSFFMNNLIEQYLLYNTDVVVIDTGDSYSGTCSYYGGKYITYREEAPITMNPFVMTKGEFNIEKKDFLVALIAIIWKGADGHLSQVEEDLIAYIIMEYYQAYFNQQDDGWIGNAGLEELEKYLDRYGIDTDLLFLEAKERSVYAKQWEGKDYYSVLGIEADASVHDVKKAFRQQAKNLHPDSQSGDGEEEKFIELTDAYEVLSDEKKRAEYDSLFSLTANPEKLLLDGKSETHIAKLYTEVLREKALEINNSLQIGSLDFNSFFDFAMFMIPKVIRKQNLVFNLDEFRFILSKFYKGGEFETTLNQSTDSSLFDEPFIVFEIDNIKDNKILFPIVTLIIIDVFIQKMRHRQHQRKALIIEEAWKAIASPIMAPQILYLYKTARKFMAEVIVVTQELDDIISNEIVKDSIISNSDTLCLLDQTKFKDNYKRIANILSLNQVEQRKIFTINNLDNKDGRAPFKEVYIKRGEFGAVYGVEVSMHQYLTYTTEKPEKLAVETYVHHYGSYETGVDRFIEDMKEAELSTSAFVVLINSIGIPLTLAGAARLLIYKKEKGSGAGSFFVQNYKASELPYQLWLDQPISKIA